MNWTKPHHGVQHLCGVKALDGDRDRRRTHQITATHYATVSVAYVLWLAGSSPFTANDEETFRGADRERLAREWGEQKARAL